MLKNTLIPLIVWADSIRRNDLGLPDTDPIGEEESAAQIIRSILSE